MQRRNFTLLIIGLVIVIIAVSLFLYSQKDPTLPGTPDEGGTNFFSQFNPFGNDKKEPQPTPPPVDVSGYTPPPGQDAQEIKLKKVSSVPVAGFVSYSKERLKEGDVVTEFATFIRYVDRATGNIFQTFADKIEERKFLDITIPKVYEAYFGNHGETVVMRYLGVDRKTIESFIGTLPKEYLGADSAPNAKFNGSFLPSNTKDVSISPDASKIFYLFESGNGIVGTILNLSNNKKTQIFDSAFTEWLPWWGSEKLITLSTKPSSGVPGFVYSIDNAGKNMTKLLGNVNGLTTLLSPNGKMILYGDNNLSLYTYEIATGISTILGIKTLPEKCVWGKISDTIYCGVPITIPSGNYPDSWYQGEMSFSDQLWKVDLKNGNTTFLVNPATIMGGEEIDGIKFALDENENYLFFVNKKDSFLWEFNLK